MKKLMVTNLLLGLWWGVIQLMAEVHKIAFQADLAKFPRGLADLHPLEELFEGFLPVFLMLTFFTFFHFMWKKTYPTLITKIYFSGAIYALLVVKLGEYLHAYCGVADVKLLQILTECLVF